MGNDKIRFERTSKYNDTIAKHFNHLLQDRYHDYDRFVLDDDEIAYATDEMKRLAIKAESYIRDGHENILFSYFVIAYLHLSPICDCFKKKKAEDFFINYCKRGSIDMDKFLKRFRKIAEKDYEHTLYEINTYMDSLLVRLDKEVYIPNATAKKEDDT